MNIQHIHPEPKVISLPQKAVLRERFSKLTPKQAKAFLAKIPASQRKIFSQNPELTPISTASAKAGGKKKGPVVLSKQKLEKQAAMRVKRATVLNVLMSPKTVRQVSKETGYTIPSVKGLISGFVETDRVEECGLDTSSRPHACMYRKKDEVSE